MVHLHQATIMTQQQARISAKVAFFILFIFAPLLDLFRFDLALGHFIIFGQPWTISIDSILYGGGDSVDAAIKIFTRVLLPGVAFVAIAGAIIWKFGRIYCGWLCPHFSVVELVNDLMMKQLNRVTVWEKPTVKNTQLLPRAIVTLAAIMMAFVWAVALASYMLTPIPLLHDLVNVNLGFGATLFISVATIVFSADFIFARHVFCKYGCALGLFQSLIWMANKKAMVIKFDRARAKACRECIHFHKHKPCDQACPMRLPTRNMKRAKFTCTQCVQCVSACNSVQKHIPEGGLLSWVSGDEAVEVDRPAAKYKSVDEIDVKEVE